MVFNRKGSFFLKLDDEAPEQPVAVAPVAAAPAAEKPAKGAAQPAIAVQATSAVKVSPDAAAPAAAAAAETGPVLTTAEAIAAELRAAQANRPAPSTATFAPDCLTPGSALPMRRRRAGANLAEFKAVAGSLLGKK